MSGQKGMKHYGATIIDQVLAFRGEGKTHREIADLFGLRNPETNAPTTAPIVVAISRNIPIRILVKPSFTKATAAPEEVPITETSEAPIA